MYVRHIPRIGIGLFLFALGAWLVYARYFRCVATTAALAGQVVAVRAPRTGVVKVSAAVGTIVQRGTVFLSVEDDVRDDIQVQIFSQQLTSVSADFDAVSTELDQLGSMSKEIREATRVTRAIAQRHIAARIKSLETELAAASSGAELGRTAMQRLDALRQEGLVTSDSANNAWWYSVQNMNLPLHVNAELQDKRSDLDSLRAADLSPVQALNERDYNVVRDRASLEREQSVLSQRARALHDALVSAKALLQRRTFAADSAPFRARVIGAFVAPGLHVLSGFEALHVVDCKAVRVMALVREELFERVRIGDRVKVTLSDGSRQYGKVTLMPGNDGVRSWYAPTLVNDSSPFRRGSLLLPLVIELDHSVERLVQKCAMDESVTVEVFSAMRWPWW